MYNSLPTDDYSKLLERVARHINHNSERVHPIILSLEDILAEKQAIAAKIFKSSRCTENDPKFLQANIFEELTRFLDRINSRSPRSENSEERSKSTGRTSDRDSSSVNRDFNRNFESRADA